eukprot:8652418-Prorocentrum_lima.AAC.1
MFPLKVAEHIRLVFGHGSLHHEWPLEFQLWCAIFTTKLDEPPQCTRTGKRHTITLALPSLP